MPAQKKAGVSGGKRELTPKQAAFVDEYLKDLNATQAAIRAGYSAKTAHAIGDENLRKPEIQISIQRAMKAREKRTEITQDRVLQEFARLAFFDPRKLFDADGRPLPINMLDDDTAAAVAGIDVARTGNAEMGVGEILKIKIADKKGALDSVARHLGMFNDKLALSGKIELTSEQRQKRIAELAAKVSK